MLPDNTYIALSAGKVHVCQECGAEGSEFLVANEFTQREDGSFGIQAVVRFDPCGHVEPTAEADPVTIAILTDFFEALPDEESDGET